MQISIGITNSPKELTFESDADYSSISEQLAEACKNNSETVTFTDTKNNTYIVTRSSVAYIQLGAVESRKIGFVG
ncbi:DUF3107 family protein [Canibacter sp. lx-72]|uniref:DUF3107 domain-containing protein n=1 Tax=Canibacter zhuwentaonis TaxID=2837491 RepID=UPI001BDCCC01|nr:DUF3107 domain-containing protein [Canibacter zhuwentaonis]MBT1017815.1 DUF3107 family protein [Canibacter zhuwentaonis]MBT1034978.1 DUF3107 family protein [Canibacter zhuwentaonis]